MSLFQGNGGQISPLPVNRTIVEKVAPPEITKNVRAMFESGNLPDRHEVKKINAMLDMPREPSEYEMKMAERQEGLARSNENISTEAVEVQKGSTKSLLSQWNQKGAEEFHIERKAIKIAESDGKVFESQPVVRSDVVRCDEYTPDDQEVQKGTTQNLLKQWSVKGTEEFKQERKPIKIAECQGQVLENTPIKRHDVVNSNTDYVVEGAEVQKGTTKNLLSQWKNKGDEEFVQERKPINLAECQGQVLESTPIKRLDVVNSNTDYVVEGAEVQKGTTKNLLSQWKNKGDEEFVQERRPINLAECQGQVLESTPIKRHDVVNSNTDYVVEGAEVQKGTTKNLLSQWKNKGDEEFVQKRKPINLAECQGQVLESTPIKRHDVVNSNTDYVVEGAEVQKGTTKNLLSQWKNKGEEEFVHERKPINLAECQGQVLESIPIKRHDVVNSSSDYVVEGTEVEKGTTKNLLSQWKHKGGEEFVHERKPINIAECQGQVLESTPIKRHDVVNSSNEYIVEGAEVEKGTTKNLLSQWKHKGEEEFRAEKKPICLIENENSGSVVESQPSVRTDVTREEDNTEEVRICAHQCF